MAEFYPSVEAWIDAGHFLPDDPECGIGEHGHQWRVKVSLRGSYDPGTGRSANVAELKTQLFALAAELQRRPLNTMIAPARPTMEGLGLWVIERLLPSFPKIVEVQVWRDPQVSCSIQRQPR